MIWVSGRIVPDLTISVRDRTFEHGLGLFETLRTWNGHPRLLTRHLARLQDSTRLLRIPLDPATLPDAEAVAALLRAEQADDDRLLRITLTGGTSEASGATLWMRSAPLPPPARKGGALVDVGSWWITRDDPLARHKTLNYWSRRVAHEAATRAGFDEVLSMTLGSCVWEGSRTNLPEDRLQLLIGALLGNCVWEGSRTNLFLVCGQSLITPALSGPIVPGVMRALVLELAAQLPLDLKEVGELDIDQFDRADEIFLTNSVRGIIPVRALSGARWPAPGPWTERLMLLVSDWLASGGTTA